MRYDYEWANIVVADGDDADQALVVQLRLLGNVGKRAVLVRRVSYGWKVLTERSVPS